MADTDKTLIFLHILAREPLGDFGTVTLSTSAFERHRTVSGLWRMKFHVGKLRAAYRDNRNGWGSVSGSGGANLEVMP